MHALHLSLLVGRSRDLTVLASVVPALPVVQTHPFPEDSNHEVAMHLHQPLNSVAAAVQIPSLERVHGRLPARGVQVRRAALAELVAPAVDADHEDGRARQPARLRQQAGHGVLEPFAGAQPGQLSRRVAEGEQ
ncbi:hypothetical protein VTK73DRAFT_5300 [Phialemonium thermophilum]|uniref:Secreted protein n=1 Tax=Phialemonium thermophilum TaxID=223376 RepID=A0ABR3V240_9PEZI